MGGESHDYADDLDPDEDDEMAEAEMNCGQMADGQCMLAGTEYCDWECPFADELRRERTKAMENAK